MIRRTLRMGKGEQERESRKERGKREQEREKTLLCV